MEPSLRDAWGEVAYRAEALGIDPERFLGREVVRPKTIDELQDEINDLLPEGYVFTDKDAHLMRRHGWTLEMITTRVEEPDYKQGWHERAHAIEREKHQRG